MTSVKEFFGDKHLLKWCNSQSSRIYILGVLFLSISWLNNDHYQPWMSFHSETLAFFGISILFASILSDREVTFKSSSIITFLLILITIPWIQFANGLVIFSGDALLSSIYLTELLIAILIGTTFVRNKSNNISKRYTGLMHSLWIVMFISVAIGLCQWLGIYGPFGLYLFQTRIGDRVTSNLAQANHLSTFILIGITAYWYAYERKFFGTITFYFGIVFSTFGLILTQSRSGMVSAMVMVAFLAWKNKQGNFRFPTRLLVIWLVFVALGVISLPGINDLLGLGAARSLTQTAPVSQRWHMWQQIAYAIAQSPWFGYGWNQTPVAHIVGAQFLPVAMTYDYAHNFVMDILAWNGLPLGLLITGCIIYWLVTRMRNSIDIKTITAATCLIPLMVHSMLEYPFTYAYFIAVAGILIGVIETEKTSTISLSISKKWVLLSYLSWLFVSMGICYEYSMIEKDFQAVRLVTLKIGNKPKEFENSHKFLLLTHMEALLRASWQTPIPSMPESDLENLRKTSLRFSFPIIHYKYAKALALNGKNFELLQQMNTIRNLYGEEYFIFCKNEINKIK